MGIEWQKYERINSIVQHDDKYLSTALDNNVYWEIKRDGSNISIQYHEGFMVVHTRNQVANSHVQGEVKGLIKDFEPALERLLKGGKYIVYFELLRAGKSPAQFEINDTPSIIAIDLWYIPEERFVHPSSRYAVFEKYGIPHIPPFITAKYQTRKEFEDDTNNFIEIAVRLQIEGFVAKWVGKDGITRKIKVKVEHKYPRRVVEGKKTRNQRARLPDLDLSEVRGAIDKVYMDIGIGDFRKKEIAMPMIAQYVSEEGRKHNSQNRINLFIEYQEFLRGLKA